MQSFPAPKWGFIDKTGRFVLNAQFRWAGRFSEGLAPVKVGDKYGYIDKTGTIAIPPRFSKAESFSEGLAAVGIADK